MEIPQQGRPRMVECPHRVLRIKRTEDAHEFAQTMYVCGSCATLFEVKKFEYPNPEPKPKGPMFDRRPPWGMRSRQA